jgi:hypothetical protein
VLQTALTRKQRRAPSMSNVMQQTSTVRCRRHRSCMCSSQVALQVPYCLKCAAYLADLADPAKVAHTGCVRACMRARVCTASEAENR